MLALQTQRIEVVQLLTESQTGLDLKDKLGKTALMVASSSNGHLHPELIAALLENGASVNLQDNNGATALMLAISECAGIVERVPSCERIPFYDTQTKQFQNQIIQMLVNARAFIDSQDKNGYTALMYAVACVQTEVVELLLQNGAKPDIQNSKGETALLIATCLKPLMSLNLMSSLLKNKANVEVFDKNGDTALKIAAGHGNIEKINLLLTVGANTAAVDMSLGEFEPCPSGETALMKAASKGQVSSLQALIDAGAPIEQKESSGKTALFYAASSLQLEALRFLLKAGAKLAVLDRTYLDFLSGVHFMELDPLCSAFSAYDDYFQSPSDDFKCANILKELITAGADVTFTNKEGVNALALAAATGRVKCAEELVKAGAVLKAKKARYIEPVIVAAMLGRKEVLNSLVNSLADLNATIQDGTIQTYKSFAPYSSGISKHFTLGKTALMLSIIAQNDAAASILIKAGANLACKDKTKKTALHYAVIQKRWDTAKELVNSNAAFDAQDAAGMSPLDLVSAQHSRNVPSHSFKELIACLQKVGASISLHASGAKPSELALQVMSQVKDPVPEVPSYSDVSAGDMSDEDVDENSPMNSSESEGECVVS